MTNFVTDLLFKLADLGKWLYDFCTSTVKVGSWNINVLVLFGGAGLTVLVVARLIKSLVPLV